MESFINDLWNVVRVASPLGAMLAFLFMIKAMRDEARERNERIAIQKSERDLHERTLNGLNAAVVSVDKITSVVQEMSRNIAARHNSD